MSSGNGTQTDAVEELSQALGEVSETVTVKAQGKQVDVTVTPFRLREFANVLKCVQRLRAAGAITADAIKQVAEAGSAEEAKKGFDFLKMLLDGGDELINILSIAAGKQLQAQALNNLDLVDAARLASAVFAVNLDFFLPEQRANPAGSRARGKGNRKRGGEGSRGSWATAVDRFIGAGYRLDEVRDFTLAQVRLLGGSAAAREGQQAALLLTLTRIAVWGEKEQVETTMRALE
jgi:hypothetical protein